MVWSFPIGSVRGTVVRIHLTFVLLLAWIGAAHYAEGGWPAAVGGLVFILLLFLCVVLHEFGHVLMARRFGVKTPDITLLPIGGVARMERIPEEPAQELAVALAGPAVNIVIAAVLFLLLGGIPPVGAAMAPESPAQDLLPRLAWINLWLAAFNLVPAFPMDGGRVLRAFLTWRMGHLRATQVAAGIGQGVAYLLGLIGLFGGMPVLVFVALFVYLGATSEAHAVQLQEFGRGVPVQAAMITRFESLPAEATLADAVAALIRGSQHDFPVVDGLGRLLGVLTRAAMIPALHATGPATPVLDVMERDIPRVHPRQPLAEALPLLQGNAPVVAVLDDAGALIGLLTAENIGELLMVHAASPALPG